MSSEEETTTAGVFQRRFHRPLGRKAGLLTVHVTAKGFRRTASFPLRVDVDSGEFYAQHGDVYFVSTSRKALDKHMALVASATMEIVWRRYLHIDYAATVPYEQTW